MNDLKKTLEEARRVLKDCEGLGPSLKKEDDTNKKVFYIQQRLLEDDINLLKENHAENSNINIEIFTSNDNKYKDPKENKTFSIQIFSNCLK